MRVLPILALVTSFPLAIHAQESQKPAGHEHADHAVQGGGTIPAGWTARPDDKADLTNVKVVPMGSGIHVTLGPAIILYKSAHEGRFFPHTCHVYANQADEACRGLRIVCRWSRTRRTRSNLCVLSGAAGRELSDQAA